MRAEAGVGSVQKGRKPRLRRDSLGLVRERWRLLLAILGVLFLAALAFGVAYAGSSQVVADGVYVSGLDVGGLTEQDAQAKLAARAHALATEPVVFTGGGRRWSIAPAQLAVRGDWREAAARALAAGDGSRPLRGWKRLELRLFGSDLEPQAQADRAALDRQLDVIAKQVEIKGREAALVLREGQPVVIPGEASRALDREQAAKAMVSALAAFDRGDPVALPVEVKAPAVGKDTLAAVAQQVRTALSAPVTFVYKDVHLSVTPEQMASFLELPHDGKRTLSIGGPEAKKYFDNLARAVWRAPREVDFTVSNDGSAHMIRSRDGRKLDVQASGKALLAAALRPTGRQAQLVVVPAAPNRSGSSASSGSTRPSMAGTRTAFTTFNWSPASSTAT
jgi:vancomycin resistance protein YoaR